MPTKVKTLVVEKDEMVEYAQWKKKHDAAMAIVNEAKKQLDWRLLAFFEKTLGVKTKAEYQAMSLAEINDRMAERMEAGEWKYQRGCPPVVVEMTAHGKYTAWKEIIINEIGEAAVEKLAAETAEQYAFRLDVAVEV